jgi:uncharacterized protein YecE (DUF72 family)
MHGTRVGISGWRYPGWRGTFYPADLAQRRELEFASRRVNSVEINGSFYSLQRPEYYRGWRDQTPDDFVFAVKGGRFITHMKKLKDVEAATANFFASGVLALREKLGPILWQFPPQMTFNPDRFDEFLKLLPRDTTEGAKLAKHHDAKVAAYAHTKAEVKQPIRHAFEIRHESFITPEFLRLLKKHNAAWVIADAAGLWPSFEEVTADFVYVRLHGAVELYASGYTEDELRRWARHLDAMRHGQTPGDAKRFPTQPVDPRPRKQRDVHVYFDNDAKIFAPYNAMRLAELLGVTWQADHAHELESPVKRPTRAAAAAAPLGPRAQGRLKRATPAPGPVSRWPSARA